MAPRLVVNRKASPSLDKALAAEARKVFHLSSDIELTRQLLGDGGNFGFGVKWNEERHQDGITMCDAFEANPSKETYQKLCLQLSWGVNDIHYQKNVGVVDPVSITGVISNAFTSNWDDKARSVLKQGLEVWRGYAPVIYDPFKWKASKMCKGYIPKLERQFSERVQQAALNTLCAKLREEGHEFKVLLHVLYKRRYYRIQFTKPTPRVAIVFFVKDFDTKKVVAYTM